jgi:sortase A
MNGNPNDLSIEELEKLLAEKRARQRYSARLASQTSALERGAQKVKAASAARPDVNFMRVGNRVLLAVEIFAVAGLLIAGLAIFLRLQELNRESVQAQADAGAQVRTGAPGAVATLPAGSQPPSAVTPERFKGVLKQVVPVAIPTPGPQQAVRIVIPALNVDAPVVEGDDWEALKKGAGHHANSANPGQRGNMVISGHNDVFGEIFRYIGNLKAGDEVQVYSKEAKFTYVVRSQRIVEPTDVSVMQATTEPTLTLITCYPYLVDSQRMVVFTQLAK